MATRPYFLVGNDKEIFIEKSCNFTFYTGFALSQKQKSISSMHLEISKIENNNNILEVSRKSKNPLGVQLSAFNLCFYDSLTQKSFPVENWFQASKVFESGGPYLDLLTMHPRDAKRDERLKNSGLLKEFNMSDIKWELVPRTMFYDFLYISALLQNKNLTKNIIKYDIFTDIEFNPQKSLNCQARSVAIFVSLYKKGLIENYLKDKTLFKSIYTTEQINTHQLKINL